MKMWWLSQKMGMKSSKRQFLAVSGAAFFVCLCAQQAVHPNFLSFGVGVFCLLVYLIVMTIVIRIWARPFEQMIAMVLKPNLERNPDWVLSQFGKNQEFIQFGLKIYAILDATRELSERATQKDLEMEDILDSLGEGVVAFNVSAQVTFSNRKAQTFFPNLSVGFSRAEDFAYQMNKPKSKGKSLLEGDDKLLQRCHEMVLKALQTSEVVKDRWFAQGIHLDLIASPLLYREGAILVLQDTTSEYKILEVGRNFIANASHELRTPITILLGFAEMLQNVSLLSSKTIEEMARKIVKTSHRLNKLIQGLLMLAGLEHSEKQFQSCSLLPLLENCKHLLLTKHPFAQVTIVSSAPNPNVLADSDLLDLAIMNLLENGVKYSGDSKKAELHLQVESVGPEVLLTLRDKGMGIPKLDLPYIFDRFYTVDKARQKKVGGVGLGLSIVKSIIDKHGGRIEVASVLGQGTSFMIFLPAR